MLFCVASIVIKGVWENKSADYTNPILYESTRVYRSTGSHLDDVPLCSQHASSKHIQDAHTHTTC